MRAFRNPSRSASIRFFCFWTGVDERDRIFRDQIDVDRADVERCGQRDGDDVHCERLNSSCTSAEVE